MRSIIVEEIHNVCMSSLLAIVVLIANEMGKQQTMRNYIEVEYGHIETKIN